MNRKLLIFTVAMLMLSTRGQMLAHDLWLIPDEQLNLQNPAFLHAVSGMEFPVGDHIPDQSAFVRRFVIDPKGREQPVQSARTELKAAQFFFAPSIPGLHIAAVETKPKVLALDAEKFNEYLVTDGLPHIYQLRSKEKSLDQPSRERYSKTPKAIFAVGDGKDGDPSRVLGLTLEIVPLRNPLALRKGDTLAVRVLFRGQPLPDVHLGWQHPGDGEWPRGTVRTDKNGEALIPIAQPGLMTIRLTHMIRPKTADYEWESYWTTLTFRCSN